MTRIGVDPDARTHWQEEARTYTTPRPYYQSRTTSANTLPPITLQDAVEERLNEILSEYLGEGNGGALDEWCRGQAYRMAHNHYAPLAEIGAALGLYPSFADYGAPHESSPDDSTSTPAGRIP